jgi:hypothetical protein
MDIKKPTMFAERIRTDVSYNNGKLHLKSIPGSEMPTILHCFYSAVLAYLALSVLLSRLRPDTLSQEISKSINYLYSKTIS